jgi:general secretion pathway protein J
MLAALTIAVAILGVLAQFTSQSLRNWNRGESTIATMEMLTSGLARLRTDLTLALPMRPPGTDSSSVIFAGDAGNLLFVAATGFGAGDRGLELISITVTKDQDDFALVRQRGPVVAGPAPLRDPVVLLRGRMQFRFSYRDDEGQVLTSWSNRDRLPKAVAVEVLNTAGVSVFPVPVLMKLPANLAAACLSGGGEDGDDGGAVGCPGTRPARSDQQQQQQQQNQQEGGQSREQ